MGLSRLVNLCEQNLKILFILVILVSIPGLLIFGLMFLSTIFYFLTSYSIYLLGVLSFFAIPLIFLIISIWALQDKNAKILLLALIVQLAFLVGLFLLF